MTSKFLCITTAILRAHTDEVWHAAWSHSDKYLASASKDKSAIIWWRGVRFLLVRLYCRVGRLIQLSKPVPSHENSEWLPLHILRDHLDPVCVLKWSPDDSILLKSSEEAIRMWDTDVRNPHILLTTSPVCFADW